MQRYDIINALIRRFGYLHYLEVGVNAGDTFNREAITDYRIAGVDWLITAPELAGREIVTAGGQTLLAEEYRWRIPDEDDDP